MKCRLCDNEARQAYYELEPSAYCPECNLREAQEMVEEFMEMGMTRRRALGSLSSSKGAAFADKVRQRMEAAERCA